MSQRTKVFVAAQGKNFVILACAVYIGQQNVSDGQTNA